MTFGEKLAASARIVEARLDEILPRPGGTVPEVLSEAMRHGVLGGGKRFRPLLVMESAAMFGAEAAAALDTAAAFELLHCYSLVHDDLPAMDDDDLRRGRPTVHRAFGEATAILAGDALQALAFETLARTRALPAETRVRLTGLLAQAAGAAGMAGGQYLDLEAEGSGTALPDAILRIENMKTGALIAAACEAGPVLGGAADAERAALARYGREAGLAFQIMDDILDATGDATLVGKATAKDARRGKATLVSVLGLEEARAAAAMAEARAIEAITPFGARGAVLAEAARYAARRER